MGVRETRSRQDNMHNDIQRVITVAAGQGGRCND